MSINRVNITGNLTRDPELRATAAGTQVLSFGIAVNDRRKNPQTGEWEDYPNYIDCTMFGTRAEAVGRYISKGSKVAIEGKLRYSSWERDGQKRSKLEVIVDEIEFMNSRPAASPAAAVDAFKAIVDEIEFMNPRPAASPAAAVDGGQQYAVPEAPVVEVADEDIPF